MGRQRSAGGEQIVFNAAQLKPSRGYRAILLAEDGDRMDLSYNPVVGSWYSPIVPWYEYPAATQTGVYGTTTYQGNDTSMTEYYEGYEASAIANTARVNGWATELNLFKPALPVDQIFELKKWVKAGLQLNGRVTAAISNTDATADALYLGVHSLCWDSQPNSNIRSYYNYQWGERSYYQAKQHLTSLPASYSRDMYRTGWLPLVPLSTIGVFPSVMYTDHNAANASSYNIETAAVENGQTMLLGVLTYREDGTTPTTPTITASTVTWVQVAETAFDVTGNMRAKLTVFRAQANADDYYDGCTVDYGGVTQNGMAYVQLVLVGEDRGGSNGSAAVVQSATGTASGDADVSATLSAFGASQNITIAFFGLTDDASSVAYTFSTSEFDDMYGTDAQGATYYAGLGWAHKFGNNTTPLVDVTTGDASGMIALEIKANTSNDEPLIGAYSSMGLVGSPATNGVDYEITPLLIERSFVYTP